MASRQSRPQEESLRYELKIAGQETSYGRLRMALELLPEGIRKLYPMRQVQSVYLDSHFGRALEENLAGISHREKVRFRWYGPSVTGVRGKVELKVRENTLGWKETLPVEGNLDIEGVSRTDFAKALMQVALGNQQGAEKAAWVDRLAGLEPVQWVSYEREYLTSADRSLRLTIDRNIETWDQRGVFRLSRKAVQKSPGSRLFVLELKCAPNAVEKAESVIQRLPWPVDRCSKFVLASEPQSGPVPSIDPV